jgi:hypothetical protein
MIGELEPVFTLADAPDGYLITLNTVNDIIPCSSGSQPVGRENR